MHVVLRLLAILPLAWIAAAPAAAQFENPADPCPEGTAEARLYGLNVEATLYTNGNLFYSNQATNGDGYTVPLSGEDAGASTVDVGNFWLSGVVGGEIRAAGSQFQDFSFRPGLTGADGMPPSPEACAEADRIWRLSTLEPQDQQLEDYREWPVHLGAPVIDGDGIAGNYDLASGDRPAIRGDAMAFWAMTDTASLPNAAGEPLGVDVTVEAFTINRLPTATFYRYAVTNRNDVAIENARMGPFIFWNLGHAADNLAGTDTTHQMMYVYNGSETDAVYGIPPAAGVVIAQGVLAESNGADDDGDGEIDEPGERMGMTTAPPVFKVGPTGIPQNAEQIYNRFQGLWSDGTPVHEFSEGYGVASTGAPRTVFGHPGDPVTGAMWSEVNYDGQGSASGGRSRWGLAATGPLRLEPGETMDMTFAILFGQGEGRFDSITKLRSQAGGVLRIAEAGAFDLQPFTYLNPDVLPRQPLAISRPRPNPFSDTAEVVLRGAVDTPIRVSVYDVLGRRLSSTETSAPEARVEVGAGLGAGVYVVRVEGFGFAETFTVVKTR